MTTNSRMLAIIILVGLWGFWVLMGGGVFLQEKKKLGIPPPLAKKTNQTYLGFSK